MIKDYIGATAYTDGVCKLAWENTKGSFEDVVAGWSNPYVPYKLLSGDDESNYFKVRQKCIKNSLKTSNVTFNFNGGNWYGYEVFNQKQLPELFAEHVENYNFIIPELK